MEQENALFWDFWHTFDAYLVWAPTQAPVVPFQSIRLVKLVVLVGEGEDYGAGAWFDL